MWLFGRVTPLAVPLLCPLLLWPGARTAVSNVSEIMEVLGEEQREKYVPVICQLPSETDNWRLRKMIAQKLGKLAALVSPATSGARPPRPPPLCTNGKLVAQGEGGASRLVALRAATHIRVGSPPGGRLGPGAVPGHHRGAGDAPAGGQRRGRAPGGIPFVCGPSAFPGPTRW